ncbi:MAG: type II secretion system major pseudopilin GspG [Bdellovibrionota bacterium]
MRSFSFTSNRNVIANERGMTLIEIMIVIAIIAGLMAVLGSSAVGFLNKAKVSEGKIQMKEIGKALESYNLSCNSYPTTDQGMAALVTNPGPDACSNWGPDPFLKKEPKDPWGKPFVYESDGGTFEIISLGKDRKEGGEGYDKDLKYSEIE